MGDFARVTNLMNSDGKLSQLWGAFKYYVKKLGKEGVFWNDALQLDLNYKEEEFVDVCGQTCFSPNFLFTYDEHDVIIIISDPF